MNSVSIKLTDNEDRHKISDKFKLRIDLISHVGVTWWKKKNGGVHDNSVCIGWTYGKNVCDGRLGFRIIFIPWANCSSGELSLPCWVTSSQLLWIQSSSNLQVTRTGMKCWTGLNSARIWPVTGVTWPWVVKKMMSLAFLVTFDKIFVKLAGNEDRHKSSNGFEFGPNQIIHFGVIHSPLSAEFFFPHRLLS